MPWQNGTTAICHFCYQNRRTKPEVSQETITGVTIVLTSPESRHRREHSADVITGWVIIHCLLALLWTTRTDMAREERPTIKPFKRGVSSNEDSSSYKREATNEWWRHLADLIKNPGKHQAWVTVRELLISNYPYRFLFHAWRHGGTDYRDFPKSPNTHKFPIPHFPNTTWELCWCSVC